MPSLESTLHAALDEVTPALPGLLSSLEPASETTSLLEGDAMEQLLRAFVSLMHENIDGGREQRDLVMATAVPGLVAAGQTPGQLVRTSVAFFMALQPAMLDATPAGDRAAVARWLAGYAAEYVCETLEAASSA